jgi:drug/metabolite transporter (DMT)-like permease
MNETGIVAGLATAALWSATALCFEAAARKVGSFNVNILRLLVAAVMFVGLSFWRTGHLAPRGIASSALCDLTLSGLVGFVVADLMLFQAFVLIGARLSMLIYASVPAMTGIAGYVFLGERLTSMNVFGMAITSAGIGLAVFGKRSIQTAAQTVSHKGILLAIGGSAGQTAGLLLGKRGAGTIDAFSATEVRVLAGLGGFCVVAIFARQLRNLGALFKTAIGIERSGHETAVRATRTALAILIIGGLLGPFLGVSLGLLSTQLLAAGIATTLMSIVPVLLIPISAIVFHERVAYMEVAGTVIALVGVAFLTI